MSTHDDSEEAMTIDEFLATEADPSDYIFVVTSEGKLKCVFIPGTDENDEVPESVLEVFNIFGINGFTEPTVLH